jgi:hypothetical protein
MLILAQATISQIFLWNHFGLKIMLLTDTNMESCVLLSSASFNDFKLQITLTEDWSVIVVDLFRSNEPRVDCRSIVAHIDYSLGATCGNRPLPLCKSTSAVSLMDKGVCRYECTCDDASCNIVTLRIPSTWKGVEVCEVDVWVPGVE